MRARLQVTFNEFRTLDQEAKEIKRSTSTYTRLYVVTQGETLSAIAARTYGNPALWRPIAIMNAIANPFDLRNRAAAFGAQPAVSRSRQR